MADLAKIVEDLSSLTVLEAAELSKLLEEKWGVSAAAPVAVAAVAGVAGKVTVVVPTLTKDHPSVFVINGIQTSGETLPTVMVNVVPAPVIVTGAPDWCVRLGGVAVSLLMVEGSRLEATNVVERFPVP